MELREEMPNNKSWYEKSNQALKYFQYQNMHIKKYGLNKMPNKMPNKI